MKGLSVFDEFDVNAARCLSVMRCACITWAADPGVQSPPKASEV